MIQSKRIISVSYTFYNNALIYRNDRYGVAEHLAHDPVVQQPGGEGQGEHGRHLGQVHHGHLRHAQVDALLQVTVDI